MKDAPDTESPEPSLSFETKAEHGVIEHLAELSLREVLPRARAKRVHLLRVVTPVSAARLALNLAPGKPRHLTDEAEESLRLIGSGVKRPGRVSAVIHVPEAEERCLALG